MDRNRESRRGSMAAANGLSRRRQRSSSLRDSPVFAEDDGPVELHETARLRDRGNKKDRDRDRSSRNKRRRGDRLMHGSNREEGEESTEESVDDEEEDEDEDSGAVRMLHPNPASSSSLSNHPHRKSFPPAKVVRAPSSWKAADEMIGVSVPRKARSAFAKRSHECWISGGVGGNEQIHRQASTSPARPNATAPSPAPISPPSSSNVSVRKKMKPIGPKHRPPKISKSSPSIQEDIEIEVAEVLYGLMKQSQCPQKQEMLSNASQKLDTKDTNGSSNEAKSRVSSPIPISPPPAAYQPSVLPQNSSSLTISVAAMAPKRKRPRPVKFEEEIPAILSGRIGSMSSAAKVESEQPAKMEIPLPKLEKNSGTVVENAGASNLGSSQSAATAAVSPLEQPQSVSADRKPVTEESGNQNGFKTREEVPSPKKESPCAKLDVDLDDATAAKAVSTSSEVVEIKREQKFKIDLMAPPLKTSPERDSDMDCASEPKSVPLDVEMVEKMENVANLDENSVKIGKPDPGEVGSEEKETDAIVKESESQKERILSLRIDLEKLDKDSGTGSKQQQHRQIQKQQQQQPKATRIDPKTEKTAQPTSLPLPMTLPGWPGGLPPLGYMPPVQAVLSMDGSTGSSTAVQPPHFLPFQHRPKKCATHFHIARTIHCHQQFTRMNPFWPAAAGSASLYGTKPYNLNLVPPAETAILGNPLQGSFPGRNLNSAQDKGQVAATFSSQTGKDKSSANFMDPTQRRQLVLQQAPQPAAAGNLLHGPAFIFPMNQQQAAATSATRSGTVKSANTNCNVASSSAPNSAPGAPASSSLPAAMATTVSFNYPTNEAQYLAMVHNSGYPIPISAHVGAPPPYRGGSHAQAMPFFYSPQMIPPSALQQQQQQQTTHSQPQPIQQSHQNTSTSSGSSSSQKHQQTQQQQQRLQSGVNNGWGGSSNSFSASKNRLPQQQNQHVSAHHQSRQLEAHMGGEDSPSTADSRVSHAHKSVYGQNFAVPIHPQSFALMSQAALGGGGSGNNSEKQQQQLQQQSLKGGMEFSPQPYAMSFAPINGTATAPDLDFSTMVQNHAFFHGLPEAARHGYQVAPASAAARAVAAQQQKNNQISEGKTGGDSINCEDERKAVAGKTSASVGQSLAFSRSDSSNQSVPTIMGNTVIDGLGRTLNLITAPANGIRASLSTTSTATTTTAAPPSAPSSQHRHHQQLIQLQQQQQQLAATARSKTSTSSNASVYPDRLPLSSSLESKFPNTHNVFSQGLMQSNSPTQSPQWKNSTRTTSPSLASTTTSSHKNPPQQQSRTQGHTQISFGMNLKSATAPQGQQLPINNQTPSPPLVVGSPPTSSISKSTGGSPRTTSSSGKVSPAPTSSQQPKSSTSGPSSKSSPVGARNVPSILGNSHLNTAPNSSAKSQSQVQLQQQQQQKQNLKQPQLFFTNATYMQAPSPQSTTTTTTTTSATTGYHHQRHSDAQQQQQLQHGSSTTSNGMLSLCPSLMIAGATISDPSKAVTAAAATAANNMKGGLPPQGLLQAAHLAAQTAGNPHQLMHAAFPYLTMPTVSMTPAEQKQPAG